MLRGDKGKREGRKSSDWKREREREREDFWGKRYKLGRG